MRILQMITAVHKDDDNDDDDNVDDADDDQLFVQLGVEDFTC